MLSVRHERANRRLLLELRATKSRANNVVHLSTAEKNARSAGERFHRIHCLQFSSQMVYFYAC